MGQKREVILASHGHRQINPCLQGLILVKFARLTLPLNPSSSNTWIKRLVPFVQSIFLKVLRWGLIIKNRRFGLFGQFGICIPKRGLNFQPSILKQPKGQNYFFAFQVVFLPYLSTAKLSCLQKNIFGHTNLVISDAMRARQTTILSHPMDIKKRRLSKMFLHAKLF